VQLAHVNQPKALATGQEYHVIIAIDVFKEMPKRREGSWGSTLEGEA
jgi:hypothetical protein